MFKRLFCKHKYKFANEARDSKKFSFRIQLFRAKEFKYICEECGKIKWSEEYSKFIK